MTALAAGLARAGDEVTVATYEHFRPVVEGVGLGFHRLPGDPVELLSAESSRSIARAGASPLRYLRGLRKQASEVRDVAYGFVDASLEACRGADAIVYGLTTLWGGSIAELLDVPGVQAFTTVVTPTRAFPSMLSPLASRRSRAYNRASHLVAEQVLWQPFRPLLDGWRRRAGLPPLGWRGPLRTANRRHVPLLYGVSPSVLPRPRDWGPWIELSGFWFLDDDTAWEPDADLAAFLADGDPPVCIDFSSVTGPVLPMEPDELARLLTDGVLAADRRALVLRGWSGLDPRREQDGVHVAGYVPHGWLFPQVAAVVHAAGPGTLGAALRAGVPSVTVPVMTDQPFWARHAAALGVAPPPLPLRRLTVAAVSAAVRRATGDAAMRARAEAVARAIAAEDGPAAAASAFATCMRPGSRVRSETG
jgi:UDP:flavonoid glycosyltransferase YjiC (YdhE family)